jgi:hypothetical protein
VNNRGIAVIKSKYTDSKLIADRRPLTAEG